LEAELWFLGIDSRVGQQCISEDFVTQCAFGHEAVNLASSDEQE
jgi:hypothetical protein